MEQIWIGYFVHQRGQTANVDDIPPRAEWEQMLAKVGLTVADLDQEFASYATRQDPAQERVQLQRAPNITASPVPDPNVPPSVLGNKAANWLPDQAAWDWYKRNQDTSSYAPAGHRLGGRSVGPARCGQPPNVTTSGLPASRPGTRWPTRRRPNRRQCSRSPKTTPTPLRSGWARRSTRWASTPATCRPVPIDSKAKAPLPPQQFATGPQGFEYSRPAEGAVYPASSNRRRTSQPEPERQQRRLGVTLTRPITSNLGAPISLSQTITSAVLSSALTAPLTDTAPAQPPAAPMASARQRRSREPHPSRPACQPQHQAQPRPAHQ